MHAMRVERRTGVDHLATVTELLQRTRAAHPTEGLYEAADFQWWWRTDRATDELPQLFWFDDAGRPVAAAILTAWESVVALDPLTLPGSSPDLVAEVFARGLDHARALGIERVGLEVDRADEAMCEIVGAHGFTVDEDGIVEAWLAAEGRPAVSPLADGYRLARRTETSDRSHHMVGRSGADVERRLRQTSLYRPELDLVVVDEHDDVAAYGLFWVDPTTSTGLVEPMRTEDAHQRRGLARHVLTTGVDLLARAGAERIKIGYHADNPASGHLYRSVGFVPFRETVRFAGPTG